MKYILKISTTGMNPFKDNIYRVVIKSVERGTVYDKYIKECPDVLISSHSEIPAALKAEAIQKKNSEGVSFAEVAKVLKKCIEGQEIIGFYVNFDLQFILYKMNMLNMPLNISNTTIFDLKEKEMEMYGFGVDDIYKRETNKTYDWNKHFNATYSTQCYEEIYKKLIEITPDPISIWGLNRYFDENGVFKQGKYKGKHINDRAIPNTYFKWLYEQNDLIVNMILKKMGKI